jgi:hypothetical protein
MAGCFGVCFPSISCKCGIVWGAEMSILECSKGLVAYGSQGEYEMSCMTCSECLTGLVCGIVCRAKRGMLDCGRGLVTQGSQGEYAMTSNCL